MRNPAQHYLRYGYTPTHLPGPGVRQAVEQRKRPAYCTRRPWGDVSAAAAISGWEWPMARSRRSLTPQRPKIASILDLIAQTWAELTNPDQYTTALIIRRRITLFTVLHRRINARHRSARSPARGLGRCRCGKTPQRQKGGLPGRCISGQPPKSSVDQGDPAAKRGAVFTHASSPPTRLEGRQRLRCFMASAIHHRVLGMGVAVISSAPHLATAPWRSLHQADARL